MKDKTNKKNPYSTKRILFTGLLLAALAWIVGINILAEIGPEPGGIFGTLLSPGCHGFCPYLTPIFNMIGLTLFLIYWEGGTHLGLVFRNRNMSEKDKSDLGRGLIVVGTGIIAWIVYTGILTVKFLLGYGSPDGVDLTLVVVLLILGLTVGAMIAERKWIINKMKWIINKIRSRSLLRSLLKEITISKGIDLLPRVVHVVWAVIVAGVSVGVITILALILLFLIVVISAT